MCAACSQELVGQHGGWIVALAWFVKVLRCIAVQACSQACKDCCRGYMCAPRRLVRQVFMACG